MNETLWSLPVPSTGLLDGVAVEPRPRRELALRYSREADDGDAIIHEALVFHHVEAYKCAYLNARDDWMLEAYDRLVNRGASSWRDEVAANLRRRGEAPGDLVHLEINFDGGPCIEVVCRGFRVDRSRLDNLEKASTNADAEAMSAVITSRFHVAGLTRINDHWGDAPADFLVQLHCEVRETDGPGGGEAFAVAVTSPGHLARELEHCDGFEFGRGYLFMLDYDEKDVVRRLQKLVDGSGAASWQELKSYIVKYFEWI